MSAVIIGFLCLITGVAMAHALASEAVYNILAELRKEKE